jgi:8-oxo-dGTP diphosphatase
MSNQPRLTADIIIAVGERIALISRRYAPLGWALPGGFVEAGETVEEAAQREAFEETSMHLTGLRQFHVYSDPDRDPRQHTVSVVFVADGHGRMQAADDAKEIRLVDPAAPDVPLAFDHARIVADYVAARGDNENVAQIVYNTPHVPRSPT